MRSAEPALTQPPEQLRYARVLDLCSRAGLLVLVLSFAVYALGLAETHWPVERLPEVWQHPVGRYLELTNSPAGWGWLALVHRGDVAGLVGIVMLAGCSLVCLLALVPLYLRSGDRVLAWLCVAEVGVVLLAGSGVLGAGH